MRLLSVSVYVYAQHSIHLDLDGGTHLVAHNTELLLEAAFGKDGCQCFVPLLPIALSVMRKHSSPLRLAWWGAKASASADLKGLYLRSRYCNDERLYR